MDLSNTNLLKTRLRKVSESWQDKAGESVLYVMSRDQRVADNHALLAAQKHALALELPFAVVFCMYPGTGQRAREHFEFMLDWLREVERSLEALDIPLIVLIGQAYERLSVSLQHYKPAALYFDFSPLRGSQKLAERIARQWPTIVVDTHNIVPVWVTSDKQEYAARTIRSKIHRNLANYLQEPEKVAVHPYKWLGPVLSIDQLSDQLIEQISKIRSNGIITPQKSGEAAAQRALEDFIALRLRGYANQRNDPTVDGLSNLSPYLHFGQLSSLRVILQVSVLVSKEPSLQADSNALIEELVVRKELSDNYCFYNDKYDSLAGAADWALATLNKHALDSRDFIYSRAQFENAETHDAAWNAAQMQLTSAGKIHGYMRMYWAKKVLEWSESPECALKTLLYLNDFYSIDGGDPNGYVGILWSIAGLHDRPWGERPTYGTIRCMVYGGLKRKFNIQAYIDNYSK